MAHSNTNVKSSSLDEDRSSISIVSHAKRFGDCPVLSPTLMGIIKGQRKYFLHFRGDGDDTVVKNISVLEVTLDLKESQNVTTEGGSTLGIQVTDAYVHFDSLP